MFTQACQKNMQGIRSPFDELQKNSKFVYRNRTQLYGVYTSKSGNKVLWSGTYKRVIDQLN